MNKSDTKSEGQLELHKAAVIGENGEEIAITEDMIQSAIKELEAESLVKEKTG